MNIAVKFILLFLCFLKDSNSSNIFTECHHFDGVEMAQLQCDESRSCSLPDSVHYIFESSWTSIRPKVKHLKILSGSSCTNLESAPLDGYFWNVRHLDYSNGRISKFYSNLRFRYLEVFDASHNLYSSLWPAIFEGQPNLRKLDFGFNYISILRAQTFDQTPNLSAINLTYNSLSTVDAEIFSSLRQLKMLDLSFNQIVSIDKLAFQMNEKLDVLNLKGNPLKRFDCHFLSNLNNLHSFDVSLDRVVELDLSCEICQLKVSENADFIDYRYRSHKLPDVKFSIYLKLNGTQTEFSIDSKIVSNFRHLNIAGLKLQSVTNVLDHLGSALEFLDMSSNHVGELTVGTFAKLPHLKHLKLSNTNLSLAAIGTYPTNPFHQQTELTHLDLSQNYNERMRDLTILSSTLSHLIEFNIANCYTDNASVILTMLTVILNCYHQT